MRSWKSCSQLLYLKKNILLFLGSIKKSLFTRDREDTDHSQRGGSIKSAVVHQWPYWDYLQKYEWLLGSCTTRKSQPSMSNSQNNIEESPSQSFIHFLYTLATQDHKLLRQWVMMTRIESEGLWPFPFLLWGNVNGLMIATTVPAFRGIALLISLLKYYVHHHSALCWWSSCHLWRKYTTTNINAHPTESILTVTKLSKHLLFLLAMALVGIYPPSL